MDRAAPTEPENFLFRRGVMETLACGVTALAYIATLSFGFVYDDVPQILKNPAVHSWRFVPQFFTAHVWAAIYPNTSGNYYRPLFLLWLRVNYALFGPKPFGWHLTSIACHVLATWLVFRLVERCCINASAPAGVVPPGLKSVSFKALNGTAKAVPYPKTHEKLSDARLTAFIAALIFGVHPAHVENVAWISGVTDPLMACFVLGSLCAFLSFRESRNVSCAALSVGLFALALLSKETAVVLPVLIFAGVLIFVREGDGGEGFGRRLADAMRESVPFLLVVVIYAAARFRALGGLSHPTIPIGWKAVFLTWPAVLWFYAQHLILPLRSSEFYPLDYVGHATAGALLRPLALMLVTAVVFVVLFWAVRERSQKTVGYFALALIIIPLLPVLDLRSLTPGDIVHDRYLYLPSAGFAVLLALFIRECGQRLPEGRLSFAPAAITMAIVAGFAGVAVVQQLQWASDLALYSRGLQSAPANLTVRDNLANALMDANQPARAIQLYLDVLQRDPSFWRSNFNLGLAYYKVGNYEDAEGYLQRAIKIDPADADQYVYLALAQLRLKKPEAAENARRALARNPHGRGYHYALGLIYEAAGDRTGALAEFRTEMAEHPENATAAVELRKLEGMSPTP